MLSLRTASLWLMIAAATGGAIALELPNFLTKDVVIIGGGASGAYAGVRLRDDFNKSIAIVEMQDRLGGMVNTYIDPATGTPYDYGVQSFLDLGNATGFFERFGIETAPLSQTNVTTEHIDFNTGAVVNLTLPSFPDQVTALQKFLDVVKPWTDYLQPGYWNFPQPADIPEDFLIPFGDFITKYGLEDAIPLIYETTGLGLGNMTQATTMFELQAFGTYMAQAMTGQLNSYHPSSGGNQALYNAIQKDLGDDVLYNSTVIRSLRTKWGVLLTVQNHATGHATLITARQLLIAIEPTDQNLAPFDLDDNERTVLSKFTYTKEYSGIVNNSAFAPGMSYTNMAAGAAPDKYLILPNFPFTNEVSYIGGDNLFRVIIAGDDTLDEASAKTLMQKNFETLLKAGRLAEPYNGQQIEWVSFSNHGPMHARVSVEDVQAGLFQDLNALQGQRSTWWTGGAFSCNFQTTLWEFDETLIPKILANLG
ncbi:conserved hypothetical protein [Talaromyces stipitatus ATCC 10500]|uniref:Amine oxidase, flavin-containing superfamily n=1 Tax=Talaromyces stipitatus (strain ATCC 10500 / CBS 375.48 / QM 6759 / NRRL 1006) TaxID=441959 RepID=B8MLU9_TALSN|nr:uncharacterized protein TSTA_101150 [Talaromyces stipitatus ATCC 10500]EED13875.1 conserved hypothetical protein [Talaromyces stipitatus ATCC 10500]